MSARGLHKILLVDDDADIRRVATICLERVGEWAVVGVGSGAAALAVAAVEAPDVVLLDVMMPGMDGPETLAVLRADPRTRSIPVIFMTARVLPEEVEAYLRLGARGVIQKPFDPMALPGLVQEMFDVPSTPTATA